LATVACGSASATHPPSNTPASAPAEDDEATAGLVEHHRYHHHGGVTLLIAMSLDTLGVSPEQRAAVERVRSELHARMEPAHLAEQKLMVTLADGLDSGSIDAAKVNDAVAGLATTAAGVHNACAEALDELHSALTPEQRAALVDKVEAHWIVWQKANEEETEATRSERGHLATLTAELDLTADQVDKIRTALRDGMQTVPWVDPQEIATYLHTFGEAFRGEKFDSKGIATASAANAHMVHWGAAHMARFIEAVSPVLTPDQRAALAQRLREHATHNPSAAANP
jgi:Spy/CpxP family protein refolding chaperone